MAKLQSWHWAVIAIVGIGAVMLLSDRPTTVEGGGEVIRNRDDYKKNSDEATLKAVPIFRKVDEGGEPTPEEVKVIRDTVKKFRTLQAYDPRQVSSFYGGGRCYMILGEKQKAAEQFEQSVMNLSIDAARDRQEVRYTAYDAMAQLASVCMDLGAEKLSEANSLAQSGDKAGSDEAIKVANTYYNKALTHSQGAVDSLPQAPKYWLIHGNVLLAVGKREQAQAAIKEAKKLDPNNKEIQMMAKMVGV